MKAIEEVFVNDEEIQRKLDDGYSPEEISEENN